MQTVFIRATPKPKIKNINSTWNKQAVIVLKHKWKLCSSSDLNLLKEIEGQSHSITLKAQWDLKNLNRGLNYSSNNDVKAQAEHISQVIIMVVFCVVIADCKASGGLP